jgi:ABC-type nickel/cobalt efflux system permease component RcnA
MRRLAPVVAAALVVLAVALAHPREAAAHPLGNFTVNHYAGIELAGDRVFVHYVLDLAEIPTFQSGDKVRAPDYAAHIASDLELDLDGKRVVLHPLAHRVSERPGAGGLPTLRFEAVYGAPLDGAVLSFVDRSFPTRIGWREITMTARDGARVVSASVPATSRSDELRAYPRDLLRSPLDVRSASARVVAGPAPGAPARLDRTAAPSHRGDGLAGLIGRDNPSFGVVLLSLLVAAFWGAAHALTPGHGKALVAGYLVGTRGRPRHAFVLGATVTVTHTAGVFGLGLVTLALSAVVVPEQLYPWLTLVSGALVVGVGTGVLLRRARSARAHHYHHHHHDDTHEHHHHGDDDISTRGILGIGAAAGLLPCPSALVVLLSAIALHKVAFGLALILAFSVGLATTITAIGLAAVLARRAFGRARRDGPVIRALPAVSAAVIVVVGLVITVQAIPAVV